MSEWEPATDAEAAMRDALRTDDQESYFRILAGIDLLLPVSADALAGLAPLGWGTWSTGGRTHVLAFTSPAALQACLADYTGSARRVPYGELADTWPNLEWWLAVNPGLPIEGYLPAWFVAQLSRGDLRLPPRESVRETAKGSQNPHDRQAAAQVASATPGGESGGPMPPEGTPPHGDVDAGGLVSPAAPAARGTSRAGPTASSPGDDHGRSGGAYGAASGPGGGDGDGDGTGGEHEPGGAHGSARRHGPGGTAAGAEAAEPAPGQGGPGGLPVRTPAAVLPSGLPSRVPASSRPGSTARNAGSDAAQSLARDTSPEDLAPAESPAKDAERGTGQDPGAVRSPEQGSTPSRSADQGTLGYAGATRVDPATFRTEQAGTEQAGTEQAGTEQAGPERARTEQTRAEQTHSEQTRTDQPTDRPAGATAVTPDQVRGALPRRQVTPPSERPPSMAAAAQALAGNRPPQTGTAPPEPPAARPKLAPPVIAGAGGSERPPFAPAAAVRPEIPPPPPPPRDDDPDEAAFEPANSVESDLLDAAHGGSTDAFLSTLLLATVLVPVADSSRPGSSPGESGFAFRTEELDGERFLVVFTSRDRLAEHYAEPTRTVGVKFLDLIRSWPDPAWSFAVNPSTPIGAKYPGAQVIALANWAAESGLGVEPEVRDDRLAPLPQGVSDAAQHATIMQKTVPAEQVDYYLERGYDRVAGFVHRANEVEHLHTPAELFAALGLVHDGTPYTADAKEAFVLRWPAYRPRLYRIPYGGQSEQALRAMDGWVIERPPFRGNGFAPGEGRDVIAEFKVDSVRLPHGAQLWRMDADGTEKMIAIFDGDAPVWRKVGEH